MAIRAAQVLSKMQLCMGLWLMVAVYSASQQPYMAVVLVGAACSIGVACVAGFLASWQAKCTCWSGLYVDVLEIPLVRFA